MEQRKLRLIKTKQESATAAYGITVPPKIALFYPNTYFFVCKVLEGILLISGTKISDIQSDTLDLEDFKI